MTDADLDRIEAYCAAATEGPWFWNSYSAVYTGGMQAQWKQFDQAWDAAGEPDFTDANGQRNDWHRRHYEAEPRVCGVPAEYGDTATGRHADDARFIAAARTDLPALCAEVRRLREFIESLDHQYSDCQPGFVCVPWCQACAGKKVLEATSS